MGADLPNVRGEFRLALDRSTNGPETTARNSAVSNRCAPGRATSEARPLPFAYVPGLMKPNAR